ncbi:MAG: hypothetical protein ACI8QS_000775 [Planctomycetota bacterium]|jgi:hypothetical protein
MNLEDSYQFLGLNSNSTEEERFAAYDAMRAKLEGKMAKAPTPGLNEKYADSLLQLDGAIEAIENRLDGEDMPELASKAEVARPVLPEAPHEAPLGAAPAPSAAAEVPPLPPTLILNSEEGSAQATREVLTVEKSGLKKFIFGIFGLACLLVVAGCVKSVIEGESVAGSIVGGLVMLFIALAFFGSMLPDKKSVCPNCDGGLEIQTDELTQCQNCKAYAEQEGTTISLIKPGTVLDVPTYKITVPDEFHWPNRCCLCSSDPTRMLEFTVEKSQAGRNLLMGAAGLAAGALVVRTGGGYSGGIEAPHCDECEDGLHLEKADDGFAILFRSYDYYRAFSEVNELGS